MKQNLKKLMLMVSPLVALVVVHAGEYIIKPMCFGGFYQPQMPKHKQ